ncbi:major facilitator superfamily domain-containing protein [Lentinula aciculospora]|uniref:Major facilitator superfamily domain-containing protein n=1 Tax=Lentinula aciculospora TaxID=153920 RepID=A0A9W8ZWS1_9AGAR|nr:major facilitator superfamily domain-containing protein [Lentinula aciculospora]
MYTVSDVESISKHDDEGPIELEIVSPVSPSSNVSPPHGTELTGPHYRLYKRRFLGLFGMVVLNIVGGLSWPWFGPIANDMVTDFDFTLDQVSWLGNIEACLYLPTALAIPYLYARFGLRRCCDFGAIALVLSAWVRYAGTVKSLSTNSSYALLMLGQCFAAIAQPMYQVLGPKYSENWFNLQGRTTATMIVAIANPVGSAIGQLLSPLVGGTRQSILILGIISTAVIPFVFLVQSQPRTPPTYAASTPSASFSHLARDVLFGGKTHGAKMSRRQRFDFVVIAWIFGILVAATNTFSILTAQIMQPVGYTDDISGLMGACLLLTGLVAAIATAPLFDRVFTKHLAICAKLLLPILGGAWLSLIWAVKPHNTGGLFAIMTILGVTSVTMLPVGLELASDLTRNAEGSSAILWFMGNLFNVVFVLVEDALRAGADADPPLNMQRGLIFNGVFVLASVLLIWLIKGEQVRKTIDQEKLAEIQQR